MFILVFLSNSTKNLNFYLMSLLLVVLLAFVFSPSLQVIKILLFLEMMSLMLLLIIVLNYSYLIVANFSWFMLFSLMVCEAALGLGVMVLYARKFGSQQYFSSMFSLSNKLLAFKASYASDVGGSLWLAQMLLISCFIW